MTRAGALPSVLRSALASPGGSCYRHCDRPVRTRTIASTLPGLWLVRACPSGVVSVTVYAQWTRRDPTHAVRTTLRRWVVPASRVRTRDLRRATRHGPELGRRAERFLAVHRGRPLRVVYWRLYPFRARDKTERRLFVCWRRTHRAPVFYVADPAVKESGCPVCRARDRRSVR